MSIIGYGALLLSVWLLNVLLTPNKKQVDDYDDGADGDDESLMKHEHYCYQ